MAKPPATTTSPAKAGANARAVGATDRLAALTGGTIDDSFPRESWEACLKGEKWRVDLAAVWEDVRTEIGIARGLYTSGTAIAQHPLALSPQALREQSEVIIACIDQLEDWLRHIAPALEAGADDVLYRARGEWVFSARERVLPDLHLLRAAFTAAGRAIEDVKPGPRAGGYPALRARLAESLRLHSSPRMPAKQAPGIADALLEAAGVLNPRVQRGG